VPCRCDACRARPDNSNVDVTSIGLLRSGHSYIAQRGTDCSDKLSASHIRRHGLPERGSNLMSIAQIQRLLWPQD
jgi:hypothetical protein